MHCLLIIYIVFVGIISSIDSNLVTPTQTVNLDCSKFKRDVDILRSFSYSVQLNPMIKSNQTYAIMNDNSQVEELYIQHEINLPFDVFCLVNLHTLKVNGTRFVSRFELDDASVSTGLSPLISRLNRLRVLSLVNTTASYIPHHALAALTNLTLLEIENCGLHEIPSTITTLANLQILRLPNNHLSTLPQNNGVTEGINSLKNLTEVILSYNRFVSLEALSDLPKLNNLVATHCQLKILPIKLPKLGYLNLSNNNFDDLSDLADFASPSLLSMDFSNNKIDHIPPEINRFISLSSLYFSNNSLAYLPTNVFQLRNLRTADFRTNPIPFASATAIRTKFKSDLPYCIVLV